MDSKEAKEFLMSLRALLGGKFIGLESNLIPNFKKRDVDYAEELNKLKSNVSTLNFWRIVKSEFEKLAELELVVKKIIIDLEKIDWVDDCSFADNCNPYFGPTALKGKDFFGERTCGDCLNEMDNED